MNRDRVNELYDGKLFDMKTQLNTRQRIHWICSQVHGEKVLDVGCSQGILCLLLGREGYKCTGIDVEASAIEYASAELRREEEATRERVEFRLVDGTTIPFESESFDTVVLAEIIEHLIHPDRILGEADRVLKEGGRVIITVPYGLNLSPDHKSTYYPWSFLQTVRPFFKFVSINSLGKYIVFCGSKNKDYDPAALTTEDQLGQLSWIVTDQERIFQQRELESFAKAKKFQERIQTLSDKIKKQGDELAAMREKEQQLRNTFNDKIKKQGDELAAMREHVAKLKNKIVYKELQFRNTLRWRISSVFIDGFKLIRNFITHPVRFLRDPAPQFREYLYNIKPPPPEKHKPSSLAAVQRQVHPKDAKQANGETVIGCVMDEFTTACFKPECKIVTFRPDNWKETLEATSPQAVFVESAWRGNDGAWQYRVAKYQKNMGDELLDLLAWTKKNKIPSIFWNKEDPVHFDRFVEKTSLFSHIFTSDSDCIPKYREHVGHDRVFALPFAAQPAIHNPILEQPRQGEVCFAGTYYGDRHEERRADMEHILRPSLDFGLEIYDRQYGMTGKQAELYRFPDIYQSAIKGRLDYDEMVKAYKHYKVFLNVNSVKASPTMFSRRVFELLACGTPVISTFSKGIVDLLGDDIVFITESEEDTRKHLEHLLGDDRAWLKASVRGIRKVMEKHTYDVRLQYILEKVGITPLPHRKKALLAVLVKIADTADLLHLTSILKTQNYRNYEVILLLKSDIASSALNQMAKELPGIPIHRVPLDYDSAYTKCLKITRAGYFALMDMQDVYGADYLLDYTLAMKFTKCGFVGKHSYFSLSESGNKSEHLCAGYEFRNVSSIPSATLMAKREVFSKELFAKALKNHIFKIDLPILSLDPFNYLQNPSDKNLAQNGLIRLKREIEI